MRRLWCECRGVVAAKAPESPECPVFSPLRGVGVGLALFSDAIGLMAMGLPANCHEEDVRMRAIGYLLLSLGLSVLSLGCNGAGGSSFGDDGYGDGTQSGQETGDPSTNMQCAEVTLCGNCDQDCRASGNPFAPGASGGDSGFDGDPCAADTDCKGTCGGDGTCTGFGSGGFDGESCTADGDCRGVCDGTKVCEGFGVGTGYEGDRCQSDLDCRGTCGGDAYCDGGDSGGSGGDGSGGDSGTGSGGDDGGGGVGAGGDENQNVCRDLTIRLEHAIPTIVLLIDQSGSTEEAFGGGLNRLEAAYTALMDPNDGLIMEIQNAFRIGMSLFSSYSDQVTCPEIGDVRPELDNFDAIDRVFSRATPAGGTPTAASIYGTMRQFDVHPDQGRKLLLLATDGEPNTCQDPYTDNDQAAVIEAVEQAYTEDVETVVLSVGDDVGRPHLQDLANAGAGLPPGGAQNADFYEANDPTQLKDRMRAIIDNARSCIFRVRGGVVDPGLVDQSTVTLDGVVLEYGDANGWNYHQDPQKCEGARQCIELLGDSCDGVQDGNEHTLAGDFLCTYYDPDNPPLDGGDDGGPTIGGGDGGSSGMCNSPGGQCSYDGDCCSGVCGGGTCITQ